MVIGPGRFFDELETMTPEERARYQSQKLKETMEYAYQHSSVARNLMEFVGMQPGDFRTAADLENLPIIRKTDLIEMQKANPPFGGLLAVPPADIERIFISPGPIYEYQPSNLKWFARSFFAAGFRRGDVVVNTFTYHMSPAGILFHEGLRDCGATVVVMGTGNTAVLVKACQALKINGFVGTPTFLMTVIKRSEELGYEFRKFGVNKAWFTGEMLTTSMRKVFENDYGISTFQAYAVTEPGGAIAYECSCKSGMHLADDYIVEIVDPLSGRQVDPGQVGEIVVTPIHNRTWGLIRFGTGDMTSLITDPCSCGRTSNRMAGLVGRSGDAVKVRGMFIVAKQAEQVISSFASVAKFQIVVDRKDSRDDLTLRVEVKNDSIDKGSLLDDINRKFQDICRLRLDNIEVVAPGTIPEPHKILEDVRKWD